jgi:hypothetical protein
MKFLAFGGPVITVITTQVTPPSWRSAKKLKKRGEVD